MHFQMFKSYGDAKKAEYLNSHWIFQFFIMFCHICKKKRCEIYSLINNLPRPHKPLNAFWKLMFKPHWFTKIRTKVELTKNWIKENTELKKKKQKFSDKNILRCSKKWIHKVNSSQIWVCWPHKNVKIYIASNILMKNLGSLKMFWLQKVGADVLWINQI